LSTGIRKNHEAGNEGQQQDNKKQKSKKTLSHAGDDQLVPFQTFFAPNQPRDCKKIHIVALDRNFCVCSKRNDGGDKS